MWVASFLLSLTLLFGWLQELPPCYVLTLPSPHNSYFTSRFPNLLMAVYMFALKQLHSDAALSRQYWPSGSTACDPFVATYARVHNLPGAGGGGALAAVAPGGGGSTRLTSVVLAPALPTVPETTPIKAGAAGATALLRRGSGSGVGGSERLGFGETAPTAGAANGGPATPPPARAVVVGYEVASDGGCEAVGGGASVREFPRRPGRQLCEFYSRTGHCKFGDTCVNDHPAEHAVTLSSLGLPLRPEQPVCAFYIRHNQCKFGPICRFHHPILVPIYAGSSLAAAETEAGVAGAPDEAGAAGAPEGPDDA